MSIWASIGASLLGAALKAATDWLKSTSKQSTTSQQKSYSPQTSSLAQAAASAARGSTSGVSSEPWRGHVQYFGSPEAYARQILKKEVTGQPLTDKAAAEAFKKAYPEYFTKEAYEIAKQVYGGLSQLTPEQRVEAALKGAEALPSYTDTGRVSGPSSKIAGSNWGVGPQGQLYLPPARDTELVITPSPAGQIGVYVRPSTGEVWTTVPPEISQVTGIQRYIPPEPPQYIVQPQEMIAPIQAQIAPYIEELQRIAQGATVETAPLISQAYNQVIEMINNAEAALIKRFGELGQGVDPATQAALASLRETVRRQRENLMEEMSRRGLLQSGIWLEMENRLNQGLLTEQQKLMAARLSDLQNQLNQALLSLSQARIQAATQFGTEQIKAAEAAAQRRQQALSKLLDAAMEAQKAIMEQQREAQKAAWEQQKFWLERTIPTWEQQARVTGVIPPLYPGDPSAIIRYAQQKWGEAYQAGDQEAMDYWHQVAEQARIAAGWGSGGESGILTEHLMTPAGLPTWEREKTEREWALDWQKALLPYQYPTANALVPYIYGPTPYQQQQLSLSRSRLAQAAARAAQPTLTERTREAQAAAYDAVDDAISKGYTAEEIRASISSQYSDLIRRGVDPQKVLNYLDMKVEQGAVKERRLTPEEEERQRLQSRPGWQKLIDALLPGAQFR